MKKIKVATFVPLLAVGLAMTLGVLGCSKKTQRTTTIPGRQTPTIGDTPSSPRDAGPAMPLNTGGNTGGLNTETLKGLGPEGTGTPAAKGDFTGWKEDRSEFAALTVHFEFDKATIRPSDVSKLEEVARRMKSSFPGKALRIEGHCDERGTEEYNRSLGDRRALSVREKLTLLGLDPEMLPTISFGEEKPIDPGHNDSAWNANRRGELILLSPP